MSWQWQSGEEWQWVDYEDGASGWTTRRATAHGTQWGAREQAGEEWHRANNDVETRSSARAAPHSPEQAAPSGHLLAMPSGELETNRLLVNRQYQQLLAARQRAVAVAVGPQLNRDHMPPWERFVVNKDYLQRITDQHHRNEERAAAAAAEGRRIWIRRRLTSDVQGLSQAAEVYQQEGLAAGDHAALKALEAASPFALSLAGVCRKSLAPAPAQVASCSRPATVSSSSSSWQPTAHGGATRP